MSILLRGLTIFSLRAAARKRKSFNGKIYESLKKSSRQILCKSSSWVKGFSGREREEERNQKSGVERFIKALPEDIIALTGNNSELILKGCKKYSRH